MKKKIEIQSLNETKQLGLIVGRNMKPGDILLLTGELGVGKTTFTKSIAEGLGISGNIKSPTYTIIREYNSGRIPLNHMDIYRTEGDVTSLGLDEYFNDASVCIIEWGELLEVEDLPESFLHVTIQSEPMLEEKRLFIFEVVGKQGKEFLSRILKEKGNEA